METINGNMWWIMPQSKIRCDVFQMNVVYSASRETTRVDVGVLF